MTDQTAAAAMAGIGITIALVVTAIFLVPLIFYLISMQKALGRVAPERRDMSPGLVWLILIPIFGVVWHFFVVAKIVNSFRREFAARGVTGEDSYGWPIGLTMCILSCCFIVPILNILAGIGCLVLWILWWVKVAGYSAKLAAQAPSTPA